jgi:hypothetical protein
VFHCIIEMKNSSSVLSKKNLKFDKIYQKDNRYICTNWYHNIDTFCINLIKL